MRSEVEYSTSTIAKAGKEGNVHMKPMVAKIKAQIAMQEAHLALRVNSAAYNGDLSRLRDLTQAGTDPNIKKTLMEGHRWWFMMINDGGSIMASSAERGNPNSKDYDFRTPLHVAALRGSYGLAKLLVEAGANVLSKDRYNLFN
ncbi:Ankyrin repeat-containing protein [Artemisia annua]|uniref:Ankyrin repeat-containing protein n=1 Tax=Artemisia annua TaxID=35608 RepID=A0A2U1LX48_ARTAN|nr:Ankyrin repeat-containing protein [Artemisia annua]